MIAKDIITALNKLEAPKSNLGYKYTIDALLLMQEDTAYFNKITALYGAIANKNNTTASRVERNIRWEIETIFTQSNLRAIEEVFGSYRKNNKLPNKEFLVSLYYYIYYNMEDNPDAEQNS